MKASVRTVLMPNSPMALSSRDRSADTPLLPTSEPNIQDFGNMKTEENKHRHESDSPEPHGNSAMPQPSGTDRARKENKG